MPVLQYCDSEDLELFKVYKIIHPSPLLTVGASTGCNRSFVCFGARTWVEAWYHASHYWAVPHGKSPASAVNHR